MNRYSIYISLGSLVISVIGWVVTHNLTKSRECRKELRTKLDNLLREVNSIKNFSIDYFFENEIDKRIPIEQKIYSVFEDLNAISDDLKNNHKYEKINNLVDELYEYVTGAPAFSVHNNNSDVSNIDDQQREVTLKNIREHAKEIRTDLENWFLSLA